MGQKVVVRIMAMVDEKSKRKAMESVAEIYGIDSIEVDMKEQQMTVVGEMDTFTIARKLKKVGAIDILWVGPDKEETKEEEKEAKQEENKEEGKEAKQEENKEEKKTEEKKEEKKVRAIIWGSRRVASLLRPNH